MRVIGKSRKSNARTISDRILFGRLWRDYLLEHWPMMVVAAVLVTIEGGTLGVLAWMLKPMFDLVFVDGQSDAIVWVGLANLALFVSRGVTGALQRIVMTRISSNVSAAMQIDLPRHVMTLDNGFFSRTLLAS